MFIFEVSRILLCPSISVWFNLKFWPTFMIFGRRFMAFVGVLLPVSGLIALVQNFLGFGGRQFEGSAGSAFVL